MENKFEYQYQANAKLRITGISVSIIFIILIVIYSLQLNEFSSFGLVSVFILLVLILFCISNSKGIRTTIDEKSIRIYNSGILESKNGSKEIEINTDDEYVIVMQRYRSRGADSFVIYMEANEETYYITAPERDFETASENYEKIKKIIRRDEIVLIRG